MKVGPLLLALLCGSCVVVPLLVHHFLFSEDVIRAFVVEVVGGGWCLLLSSVRSGGWIEVSIFSNSITITTVAQDKARLES